MRVGSLRHMVHESTHHADRVLEAIPARDLDDHPVGRCEWSDLTDLGATVDPSRRAVGPRERRSDGRPKLEDAGPGQDREALLVALVGVLRSEDVDRGLDHSDLVAVQTVPRERGTGEHVSIGVQHVSAQKAPRAPGAVVGVIQADVAAPDHERAVAPSGIDQPRGLRVVQDHDVPRTYERGKLCRVGSKRPLIDCALTVGQLAAVAIDAVQMIVDSLRDAEEVGACRDHHPTGVDPTIAGVTEQRAEQLDDAAASGGRVDVPDHTPLQSSRGGFDQFQEVLVFGRRDHRLEPMRIDWRNRDVFELCHRRALSCQSRTPLGVRQPGSCLRLRPRLPAETTRTPRQATRTNSGRPLIGGRPERWCLVEVCESCSA